MASVVSISFYMLGSSELQTEAVELAVSAKQIILVIQLMLKAFNY